MNECPYKGSTNVAVTEGHVPTTWGNYSAYAKVIQKKGEEQVVIKREIKTLPPPPPLPADKRSLIERTVIERTHLYYCKERVQIEEEIRQRQDKWRSYLPGSTRRIPPSDEPPGPPPSSY